MFGTFGTGRGAPSCGGSAGPPKLYYITYVVSTCIACITCIGCIPMLYYLYCIKCGII